MQQHAHNARLFLDRITLRPAEIDTFMQVASMLEGIASGRLIVQSVAQPEPEKPKAKRPRKPNGPAPEAI